MINGVAVTDRFVITMRALALPVDIADIDIATDGSATVQRPDLDRLRSVTIVASFNGSEVTIVSEFQDDNAMETLLTAVARMAAVRSQSKADS